MLIIVVVGMIMVMSVALILCVDHSCGKNDTGDCDPEVIGTVRMLHSWICCL